MSSRIENSAPFDVFLFADAEHADKLDHVGSLAAGSEATYAIGVLALWIPKMSKAQIKELTGNDVRLIAVANPKLAPYGAPTPCLPPIRW